MAFKTPSDLEIGQWRLNPWLLGSSDFSKLMQDPIKFSYKNFTLDLNGIFMDLSIDLGSTSTGLGKLAK